MRGFIVYPTYRIIDNKAYVYLFGKLENGESFLTMNEFKPYFFIKQKDVKKALKVKDFSHEKSELKTFAEESVEKIIMMLPKEVGDLRKTLEEQKILTYEANVRFVYRFMFDNDLKGSMNIEGKWKKGNFVDRIYEEPKLTPVEYFPKLKTLSIDIETDKYAKEIFAISLYTDDYKKVLIRSKGKLKNAEIYGDEQSMLQVFAKRIQELDPDIITGWNLIDFDLKKIEERFKHFNIPFQLGRAEWDCKLRIESNFFKTSTADFPGRMILDGLTIMRNSFIRLDDYKLNTAAKVLLGDTKIIESTENKGEEIEKLFKSNKQKLVDYNLKDSELVMRILEKTDTLNLTIQRSLITGMQLDRIHASIASLDSLYLRELRKLGYVGTSTDFNPKSKPIKGAYVMESKPGIYDYVIVCDFKSLYPSVIRTFNIDPLRFLPKPGKKDIVAVNGIGYKREPGILPILIQRLWEARDKAKKKKDQIASMALKTTMNSFWGALASPNCRYY
ncbi:MAG: 3'-5' exonuclease, partial [archaeon]